jgi:hypothetical protein
VSGIPIMTGKHKHLVCRPKEGYGSSDPESDDDGTLGKLVGGPSRGDEDSLNCGVGSRWRGTLYWT